MHPLGGLRLPQRAFATEDGTPVRASAAQGSWPAPLDSGDRGVTRVTPLVTVSAGTFPRAAPLRPQRHRPQTHRLHLGGEKGPARLRSPLLSWLPCPQPVASLSPQLRPQHPPARPWPAATRGLSPPASLPRSLFNSYVACPL